jgi:hypothetical protein
MIIKLIGEVRDNPDGSGLCELDIDEEGKMYLIQLGFEVVLMRGMEVMKKEYEEKIDA